MCRDSERGFQLAAAELNNPELATLCADISAQRAKFARELEARVRLLRGEPAKGDSGVAAVHRVWMDLRAAPATNRSHAVLSECERGEDMAVKAYATALAARDLDPNTRQLIQSQYEAVQAAHDRIRQLRDRAAPGSP